MYLVRELSIMAKYDKNWNSGLDNRAKLFHIPWMSSYSLGRAARYTVRVYKKSFKAICEELELYPVVDMYQCTNAKNIAD